MMLMSHAAMSASVAGLPRPGACANAAGATQASTAATAHENLRVDMLDPSGAVDRPARDAVEMLVGESEHRRRRPGLAAHGHELGAGRLHVAALVPGAALQH